MKSEHLILFGILGFIVFKKMTISEDYTIDRGYTVRRTSAGYGIDYDDGLSTFTYY
jgi:hypothetical protein